jgi:hypothetical protein
MPFRKPHDHVTKPDADKALELWTEWLSLQKPPESLKDQPKQEAQLLALHERMVSFLLAPLVKSGQAA